MAKKTEQPTGLQELKQAIRQKAPGRLYFFYGEEKLLQEHYLAQLKKTIVEELTESFNFTKITAETFEMRSFADCVEKLPMMADRTMVLVDDVDFFKFNEGDREKIIDVFSDIPDYCTVVFTFETVEWKPDKRMKKLWEAVSKHGSIVEFAKQDPRELNSWVSRHFASAGKKISSELCAYLIDITGGTMTALSGEISKICAFSGADTVVKSDIDAVTEPVLDAVVFQMTDLMGQGEYGKALAKLQQLFKMQQEPIPILGAIGNHFRRLSTARTLLDNGRNSSDLMRLCGMADYPARKTIASAGKFSASFYRKASELVVESDYRMKTSFDDPKRILEVLIMTLAQEAKNDSH